MTTIQVEIANQVIEVTYEQYDAHEKFGEGVSYGISDVIIIVDFSKEKSLLAKRNVKEAFREALITFNILIHDFEQQERYVFVCNIANSKNNTSLDNPNLGFINPIDIDYLHQLEEGVSKLVSMLEEILKEVGTRYQIRVPLSISNY